MEANYNEPNFFARIFDCKMVFWEEKVPQLRDSCGRQGDSSERSGDPRRGNPRPLSSLDGALGKKSPAIARHVGAEGLEPPAFSV